MDFILDLIGRDRELFAADLEKHERELFGLVAGSRFLVIGGAGLLSVQFMQTQNSLLVSMVGVGIAWASILSMPYAMLASSLPPAKMGFYMGVFNFFIVIPQVLVSLVMGKLVGTLFDGDSMKAIVIGGFCLLIAAATTFRVTLAGSQLPSGHIPAGGGH
jgi:maltose/moltooligosaccharide transporter